MYLLNEVDKPGSDIDEYVENLDALLKHKYDSILQIRNKLSTFKKHLKEEEILSKKFYEERSNILDVFDLNNEQNNFGEMHLLENLPDFEN